MTYSATEIKVALREAAQQNGGRATRADAIALLDRHALVEYDEEVRPFEAVAIWHVEGTLEEVTKRFHTREETEDWGWAQFYNPTGSVAVRMTEYVDTPIGEEPHAVASIDLNGYFMDWEG